MEPFEISRILEEVCSSFTRKFSNWEVEGKRFTEDDIKSLFRTALYEELKLSSTYFNMHLVRFRKYTPVLEEGILVKVNCSFKNSWSSDTPEDHLSGGISAFRFKEECLKHKKSLPESRETTGETINFKKIKEISFS